MIKLHCNTPELEGLRYAAANTAIPVPKVYKVHRWNGKLAIEMEYFRGCETVRACWRGLTEQQKHDIIDQVAGYIKQLRELEPPVKSRVSSTNGGPCRVIRVGTVKLFGPCDDTAGFHEFLRGGLPLEKTSKTFGDKVMQIHGRDYGTRFTHGDLGVSNFLVRDGKVVAVIDWECAGWYPEYWEYTIAHYNRVYMPEFYEMLDQKIDRYDEELDAERELWKVFDQPLDSSG